ncbi:MAG: InlB B-repeat-containing protein, partial [Candidatus Phytoplasma sp.]|nr:InlB B-repeat-containing protein [Phytoplasma sp.]
MEDDIKRKIISLLSVLLVALTLIGCQEKDIKYTVTFDSNGGSLVSPIEVKKGDKVGKPDDPTKENYDFENWYEDVELQKKWEFETRAVESNLTLYAKWTKKTSVNDEEFTVVFNLGYDELKLANQIVKKGQVVNEPSDPERNGYEFLGWFIGETKYDFTKVVESNLVLTAKWRNKDLEAEEFTVIFDLGYDGLILDEKSVFSGNTVDKPADPGRNGYEFLGWFLGNSIYLFDEAVTKDIVLVAQWKNDQGPVIPEEKIIYEHNFQEDELVSDYLQFGSGNTTGANYGEYTYNGFNYETGFKMNSTGKITFNLLEEKAILVLVVGTRKTSDIAPDAPFGVSINGTRTPITSPYQELKIELNGSGQYVIQRGDSKDKEFGIFFLGIYTEEAPKTMYTVTIDGIPYQVEEYHKIEGFTPAYKQGKVFTGLYDQNNQLFNLDTPILSDITLVSGYRDAEEYEVTLDLDGGTLSDSNEQFTILEGEILTLPIPTKDGMKFAGWYKDDLRTEVFKDKTINKNITLYAKWVTETVVPDGIVAGTNPESIFVILDDVSSNVKVEYKNSEEDQWQVLDEELIRVSNGKTRIDIVGIKAGLYDVSITTSENSFVISNLSVKALDRSGYAHFNYTEGIGGYKDDGTLKDDAIVVYVTEENKNNIEIPGVGQKGLGWILNNAQYAKAGSNTNDPAQYASSLANFNRPIVFRIIGKLTAPEGVTEYNSLGNGGSKGDNGNMARIKDANHITIEGIGSDAEIYGWG